MLALANGGGASKRQRSARPTSLGLPPALRQGRSQASDTHSSQNVGDSLALAVAGVKDGKLKSACAEIGGGYEKRKSLRTRVTCEEELVGVVGRGGGCEDAFERDVRKGFAGKLCEKMGWKPGDGLGVKGDLGIVKR